MPGFELIGEEERAAVNKWFDDGGVLFAHGFDDIRNNRYHVREFETQFAEYLGVNYAQAVSSGTAALKIALNALGVKPGDEVITQAFTFIATAEAIIDVGAKPVFVNINETLNIDPSELESAITDKTAAIVPVHMLGVAAVLSVIADSNSDGSMFNVSLILTKTGFAPTSIIASAVAIKVKA
jgi:8-amino-3,8-dideoxy-alpha-D-manno-octulosonate transaminase